MFINTPWGEKQKGFSRIETKAQFQRGPKKKGKTPKIKVNRKELTRAKPIPCPPLWTQTWDQERQEGVAPKNRPQKNLNGREKRALKGLPKVKGNNLSEKRKFGKKRRNIPKGALWKGKTPAKRRVPREQNGRGKKRGPTGIRNYQKRMCYPDQGFLISPQKASELGINCC